MMMEAAKEQSPLCRTQFLQVEAIKAFGLVVKNTFIDDAAPPLEEQRLAARRSSSVPPAFRIGSSHSADDEDDKVIRSSSDPVFGVQSCPLSAHIRRGRPTFERKSDNESLCLSPGSTCSGRDLSPASSVTTSTTTCCSTSTECTGLNWAEALDVEEAAATLEEEEAVDDMDAARELADVVARDCAFLRLTDQVIYDETSHVRRRRGVTKCVLFHCRGLPWAKRAKWLLPLLWSVAAVLRRKGCTTKVQAGELYAQLPSACSESPQLVRLDFGAAHN